MSHVSVENQGVRAEFKLGSEQKPYIEFLDPSYVRATTVLLDTQNKAVHVSLHEGIFLIGKASNDFFEAVLSLEEVELCADLHSGDRISLHATVGTYGGCELDNVVALKKEGFPTFSAGGFAVTALA